MGRYRMNRVNLHLFQYGMEYEIQTSKARDYIEGTLILYVCPLMDVEQFFDRFRILIPTICTSKTYAQYVEHQINAKL